MSNSLLTIPGEITESQNSLSPISEGGNGISLKHVKNLLEAFEEHSVTIFLLFSFIGYVIISATGNFKETNITTGEYYSFICIIFLIKFFVNFFTKILPCFKSKLDR